MIIQTKYFPGKFGLGTEFPLSEVPLEYSRVFTNRFINIGGNAEKRQGMERLGSAISGTPTITGLHEHVDKVGNVTLFASGSGAIYRYDTTTLVWSQVLTGKDSAQRLLSVQMNDKLIFVNGSDRNFYTDDGGNTFKELQAILEKGQTASGTTATALTDSNITSWLSETFVTNNDLIFNASVSAYALVTSVGASNLTNTPITASATGIGIGTRTPIAGDTYEITDLVALNIIPTAVGVDNFTTLTSGSTTNQVRVSGVDFSTTEIKAGDIISNTTRNAVTRVVSVSANLTVVPINAQAVNDSVIFFKSAMPIATYPHVHYGRLYLIDSRDRKSVRISGISDPEDFTTYQKTLSSNTMSFGSYQPQAEILLSLDTFQQYLVAAGQRNVFAFSGVDPIADTTAQASDSLPVGLFPQGCASRYGLESIGGAMIFAANDGLRNFVANFNANTFQTANISEAIKSELARAIASKASDPDELQCIHYPRRNWLLFKVGDVVYNYNYTPYYQAGQVVSTPYGSFSKFTGKFAQQKIYYVRRNGDLICAGENGLVYEFDKDNYDDDGSTITAILETSYLQLAEAQEGTQIKSGVYIRPIFETSAPITYTIEATGGYNQATTDTATATTLGVGEVGFASVGISPIGGDRVFDQKLPLRWKGREFNVRFTTDSTTGPDIIAGFYIYGNVLGKV